MKSRFTFPGIILSFLFFSVTVQAQIKMSGFDKDAARQQTALETKFDGNLVNDSLKLRLKRLSARPHHVGSVYGKMNVDYMVSRFKAWGFKTKIETYYVLFPTPEIRELEVLSPIPYKAKLQEPVLMEDGTSNQTNEQLPTYNAYSIDGDVTAEVVFVNYGVPEDYEELERRGIDVKGKIVLAKYFGSWRGIKPKVAAEHGAIGCLIYTDPMDDGYFQGDVYPKGAYKRAEGVQRGSVMDMPLFPGDPLTPGYGATKKAKRLPIEEAQTITKIPVLPISAEDARPILAALEGPVAPASWRGALPLTYHLGPSKTKVHLKLKFNWDIKEAYDVIATMKGSKYPDEWVMRGNHHDAWVNGAADPLSGLVALMEEARSIGMMAKDGWQPKRTLVYAAWDAEEPGLIGSTEWVEDHQDELKEKLVAYINTDGSGRGFLGIGGSHSLEQLANDVANSVPDPQTQLTIAERRRALQLVSKNPAVSKEAATRKNLRISPLGSGSDYSPFLQHLGIPVLNLGFGGESGGGSYHSIYDSYDHFLRFKDPKMDYGVVLAKTAGRLALRLSEAEYLPFDYNSFADNVDKYVTELEQLADNMRQETARQNKLISQGKYTAVLDPTKQIKPPKMKAEVPFINFAPLQNALARLKVTAAATMMALDKLAVADISADKTVELNKLIYQAEQRLTADGLPRRPWYVHQIYAPGFYTGYGVKTLPGVREAIEQRNWQEVAEQMQITADVIDHYSEQLARIKNLTGQ
jgi:N-acetylated-alpha-linked acidic dipeptidase